MLKRENLNLDPLLTDLFFAKPNASDEIDIFFPIADWKEPLDQLLPSEKGIAIKSNLKLIVDHLFKWAEKNGIYRKDAYDKFIGDYINYNGGDPYLNSKYHTIYNIGTVNLYKICTLLEKEEIPTDYKIEVVKDLLTNIFECATGSSTHITDAHDRLLSAYDMKTTLQNTRKEFVRDATQQILATQFYHEGNEIHIGNALTNHYAEALELIPIDDDYIKSITPSLLNILKSDSELTIRKSLTAARIIENFAEGTDIDAIIEYFNTTGYDGERALNIDRALNKYGPDRTFFNAGRLYYLNDNGKYVRSWQAPYIFFLSIAERLTNLGYLRAFTEPYKVLTINQHKSMFFPDRSLKFSYIRTDPRLPHQPLITYLAHCLYGKKASETQQAFNFTKRLSPEQKFELAVALIQRMKQKLNKLSDKNLAEQEEKKQRSKLITLLLSDINKLLVTQADAVHSNSIAIMSHMSEEIFNAYVTPARETQIYQSVNSKEMFVELLRSLPQQKCHAILADENLCSKWRDIITNNFLGFIDILHTLPLVVREEICKIAGMEWIKQHTEQETNLTLMLRYLPPSLYMSFFSGVNMNSDSFYYYLLLIPPSYYKQFFDAIPEPQLKAALFNERRGNVAAGILKALVASKRLPFLAALHGKNLLVLLRQDIDILSTLRSEYVVKFIELLKRTPATFKHFELEFLDYAIKNKNIDVFKALIVAKAKSIPNSELNAAAENGKGSCIKLLLDVLKTNDNEFQKFQNHLLDKCDSPASPISLELAP